VGTTMKNKIAALLVVVAISFAGVGVARGQGQVLVPDSTVEHPGDIGIRAHTNHVILVRPDLTISSPGGEIPASLGCVYQIVSPLTSGCPIEYNNSMPNPVGGSQTIAIVDAYDYPTAYTDLTTFSNQFNLPVLPQCSSPTATGCFEKVYASGSKPRTNCGWAQEAALDIEWAHAMAPNAKIVLVEAASNSNTNLFQAVDVATNEVICGSTTCPGGSSGVGEVSMSWGSSEFSGESSLDSHFTSSQVVYFASSGDSGGKTLYPSTSPNVVAAGGTTVNRSSGSFASETAWSGSGGGPSQYESRPGYQDVISTIVGSHRGVPDFSFDANPNTGVSVYDSTSCQGLSGWLVFGGTSVASPSLAGIANLAGHFSAGSNGELTTIYGNIPGNFRDITSGSAGSFSATTGWDFVTGVGSNLGLTGK
jgi:subtilase family serine protease